MYILQTYVEHSLENNCMSVCMCTTVVGELTESGLEVLERQPGGLAEEAAESSYSVVYPASLFPEASRKCMVGVGVVTCDFVCSGQAALLRNILDVGKWSPSDLFQCPHHSLQGLPV